MEIVGKSVENLWKFWENYQKSMENLWELWDMMGCYRSEIYGIFMGIYGNDMRIVDHLWDVDGDTPFGDQTW